MTSAFGSHRLSLYVDGLVLVHEHFSGIGQYTHGLVSGLGELIGSDDAPPGAAVTVLLPWRSTGRRRLHYDNVAFRTVPIDARSLERLGYRGLIPPLDLFAGRGMYVFPHFVRMPLQRSPSAIVIHDLCYLRHPGFMEPRYAAFLQRRVAWSVRTAQAVLTPTEAIRQEVLAAYTIDEGRVLVGSGAVDTRTMRRRSEAEVAAARARYGLPDGDYLLFLGNLEPRKNVAAVLRAYEWLEAALRHRVSLLLVSAGGWRNAEIAQAIDGLRRRGYAVVRPSLPVTDADKPAVISGALALVYPSHYEGFGLPVLEALACGTPVITSNDAALREVAGGAALHVAADDVAALTDAMTRCIIHASAMRAQAAVQGPRRAADFSWVRTARRYFEVAERFTA